MRRRHRFDLYWVIGLSIITIGFFVYSNTSAGERGVEKYSEALKAYKSGDFELAYSTFAKVPYNSNLKQAALFRQARCATNLDKKQVAIKKYKRIVHSHSKTSIVPISEYNMAYLMYELNDKGAKRQFKKIIKKYPSSDYAIASNYYLGKINNTSIPESGKRRLKAKNKSFIYFKTYIEKAPDGRYSLDAIDEIKNLKLKL